jgi:hypothetical protein
MRLPGEFSTVATKESIIIITVILFWGPDATCEISPMA